MLSAIGPPTIATRTRRMMTMPPARAALSCLKRSQKSREGDLRAMATGCSATAPPEVTWNSGGLAIPSKRVMTHGICCGNTEHRASQPTFYPRGRRRNIGVTELRPDGQLEGQIVRAEPIEERH